MKALRSLAPAVLLLLALAAAVLRRPTPVPAALPLAAGRPDLVLLLAPGLTLEELRDAAVCPTLARQAAEGLVGVMPTRADGNGTLAEACRVLAYGSRSPAPGASSLGDALTADRVRTILLGNVDDAQPLVGASAEVTPEDSWRREDRDAAEGQRTEPEALGRSIRGALRGGESTMGRTLAVAVFDDLYRTDRYAPLALPKATALQRRTALRRLDDLVADLTGRKGSPLSASLLLVAPVAAEEAAARGERLGPVLLWSPDPAAPSGLLTSPSTRDTPGLVANTDIAATVAALLDLNPDQCRIGAGRPAAVVPGSGDDLARWVSAWAAQARAQRLLVFVPWLLAGLLIASERLGNTGRDRAAAGLAAGATAVPIALLAAGPLASSGPIYGVAAVAALVAGLVAAGTKPLPTVRVLCLLTALTILGDQWLGAPLLSRSPLSYSVVEAARYYGIGNEMSGVLLGAALMTVPLFSVSWGTALLWGGAVAITSAAPTLGADAGGFVAAVAAFLALAILCVRSGKWGTVRTLLLPVLGLLLIVGYAGFEAGRSSGARTHVGEAVTAARAHGPAALMEIARRKLLVNARLAVTSPWAVLLAVEVVLCVVLWRRRGRDLPQDERATLQALAAGAVTILVLNDSGVVAAATCLLYPTAVLLVAKTKGFADAANATPAPPGVP